MTASEIIDRYRLGCPFTAHPEAPTPPALNPDLLRSVFGGKTATREEWITAAMADRNCDRFDAAIDYDMNHSPKTTNAKQLREIGVFVPSTKWVNESTDQQSHLALWDIIYGMARLGIFLVNTDSRTDRELLDHLCTKVFKDTITDIPPTPDMTEFIDLSGINKTVDRDRLLPRPDRSFMTPPPSPANN